MIWYIPVHWTVVAPFFTDSTGRWLDDFVPGSRHLFRKVGRPRSTSQGWHARAGRATPMADWFASWDQISRAMKATDGIITVFPPLAAMAGLYNGIRRGPAKPVVAWCYNIGSLPTGLRQHLARLAMKNVDHIIVHSSAEITLIADWLNIATDRISFVPLQIGEIPIESQEEQDRPFIVAMGSANRDYATFFEAVRIVNLPTVVVASPRATVGLNAPACLTIKSGLTMHECRILAQRARINVVPLHATPTASGQVTVIEAMQMARPVIATRCVGTSDYIRHGETGFLVDSNDPHVLAAAMKELWDNRDLRTRIASGGHQFARESLSDVAAGAALERVLDNVEQRWSSSAANTKSTICETQR